MGNTASSNVRNPKAERPPVSNARLIGEVLATLASAYAVHILSLLSLFFIRVSGEYAAGFWWIRVVPRVVVAFAAAITVYLIGRIGEQTGSFWATLGLSFLGGCLAFAACRLYVRSSAGILLAPLATSIGAVMGFNLTRRYKETFARKNVAQKDFFQLKKEFESKASESHSARSEQAGRQ